MKQRLSSLPRLELPKATTEQIGLSPLPPALSTTESPQSTNTNSSTAAPDHSNNTFYTSTARLITESGSVTEDAAHYYPHGSPLSSTTTSLWPNIITLPPHPTYGCSQPDLSTSVESCAISSIGAKPTEPNYTLNHADFVPIKSLGDGSTSSHAVKQVVHRQTQQMMACKLIPVFPSAYKEIQREIDIHIRCNNSPYIVHFYGTCERPQMINLYIEFMDAGSFDEIYRRTGRVPENILAVTALCVVKGLIYLKTECGVIHRDVKPSNILVNSRGEIKLCDFSVSNVLINSLAKSWAGCFPYMSPERLSCSYGSASTKGGYTVRSDIWSLGISLIELALGKCPIPPLTDEQITELMTVKPNSVQDKLVHAKKSNTLPQMLLNEVALLQFYRDHASPTIPLEYFSENFKNFVDGCLHKDPTDRPALDELIKHDFVSLHDDEKRHERVATWVSSTTTSHASGQNEREKRVPKASLASSSLTATAISASTSGNVNLELREGTFEPLAMPADTEQATWLRRIIGCCR